MLSLILALLVIKSLQPLQTIAIDSGTEVPGYGYARDAEFEYLATPQGLYRAPRLATSAPQLLAFGGEKVHDVVVHDGAVYVAKDGEHTLLRSRDGGAFEPIDAALLDCALTPCTRLAPTVIAFDRNRMYVNAGGNVLASDDDGGSWHVLYGLTYQGKPTGQICPVTFALSVPQLFLAGECPLDVGWLNVGVLKANGVEWGREPFAVITPELENRNVQFIRDLGNGIVFAGIEGALLKSTDGGVTFRFVIHYPLDAEDRYPYIAQMVVAKGVMLVGGFDKKNDVGYLAISNDGGETWQDVSALVGKPYVSLLAEDGDGRVLIGLQDGARFTLAEVVLGQRTTKRRAVR